MMDKKKHKCSAQVWFQRHQRNDPCTRNGVYEFEGALYCKQHFKKRQEFKALMEKKDD